MQNTLKTTVLMALLVVVFAYLGKLLGGQQGMILGLIFAAVSNFFSYWFSDKMVLKMYKAKEVNETSAPELYSMVRGLTMNANIPMPKVYIIQNPTPNAFATGRNPEHAAVAVTTGILNLLDHDELSGVIGHELTHIANRDILVQTIAATFAGAISILASIARWGAMLGGGRSRDGENSNPLALIAAMIFAPMAAMLIQMAISRSREYGADKGGAKICGNPLYLARALQKLELGAQHYPMDDATPETAHMFIINPISGLKGIKNLFRTHPITAERIKRLEAMAQNPSLMNG
ncbi:MAG TPA: zinc metalloprotease HtpX [Oligoflexia bacterium]|nr:zinc metalloprotease HtpX [Oligoflexia bacterium]HMR23796.1 zinc metalloprotease HtpX [Oligoflexia bacterium]